MARGNYSEEQFPLAIETVSPLHVCINNAGTTRHGPVDDADEEDWDVTSDVNLKGPFLVSQAVARTMRRQEWFDTHSQHYDVRLTPETTSGLL